MHHENKSVDNKLTTIILQYRKNVTDKASDNDVVEAVKKNVTKTLKLIYILKIIVSIQFTIEHLL